VLEAMRDSGLAHLLSIAGLHIGLVAGIVFFAVRGGLALIPFVALRWPIKKWAAVAAFAAITFYMLFASPAVPIQRSWLMTSVVLLAIVIDRTAISMRLVAWAAFAVLLLKPESLLGPSFQMSFAAVVALIAAWEVARERFTQWRIGGGWGRRALIGLAAVGMTTLVAGMASAPYALYHFNRFAAYGLAANLIAVPLTSLWVMPWAVLAFPLFLFGAEGYALVPMGWGVEAIVAVAEIVAGWGGAVALLPAMPVWGLVTITLGGLWLCLWRTPWRLAGVPVIALGLLSIAAERGPDILVSGDARLLAVRGADGALQMSAPRAARLTRETWLRRAGQEETVLWPSDGSSADGRLTCDPAGCLYRSGAHVIALVRDAAALAEDCRTAAVVIAAVPVRRVCPSAQLVIDRFALWRDGGHALWLTSDGVRAQSVRAYRGERPWVAPVPEARRARGR
jgi:competence protein ComEC